VREIVILRDRIYFYLTSLLILLSCAPEQVATFDRFSWLMAQKMYFRVIYVLFEVRTIFYLLLFFAKQREIRY